MHLNARAKGEEAYSGTIKSSYFRMFPGKTAHEKLDVRPLTRHAISLFEI